MRLRIIQVAALAVMLGLLPATGAVADSGSATFQYLVGSGVICTLGIPNACPDVARADNGDTVAISGGGMLSIHPNSATGSGTFTHKDAAGNVRATGTWTAAELLSFQSFGGSSAPGIPANWRAGQALIRVHLSPAAGGSGFDGILEVTCHLPGLAHLPGDEGISLNVQDVINFNQTVSGVTVFIAK